MSILCDYGIQMKVGRDTYGYWLHILDQHLLHLVIPLHTRYLPFPICTSFSWIINSRAMNHMTSMHLEFKSFFLMLFRIQVLQSSIHTIVRVDDENYAHVIGEGSVYVSPKCFKRQNCLLTFCTIHPKYHQSREF